MADESTGNESNGELIPRRTAAAVTIGALTLAGLHVVWPSLEIDTVTLVLIGIALAPWLAPILKSIEVGGAKFEFRELRHEVETLARQVEEVKALVISGATPEQAQRLNAAVDDFRGYLRTIGIAEVPQVAVRLESGVMNAYYDGSRQEIVLDPKLAEDTYPVLREYAHHVLFDEMATAWAELGTAGMTVESGLADYLVASHTGSPALGVEAAAVFGIDGPIRNLDNRLSFDGLDAAAPSQQGGEVWGGVFWELRGALGAAVADPLLVRVWSAATDFGGGTVSRPFAKALLAEVESAGGRAAASRLRATLRERGVSLS